MRRSKGPCRSAPSTPLDARSTILRTAQRGRVPRRGEHCLAGAAGHFSRFCAANIPGTLRPAIPREEVMPDPIVLLVTLLAALASAIGATLEAYRTKRAVKRAVAEIQERR